jgi:hypothetical protein
MEEVGGVGGENNIIDIQKEICGGGPLFEDEEGGVTLRYWKTNGSNELCEPMKPSVRCLFEAIKGSMQSTHMRGASGINKTRGLLTIHCFLNMSMKKGILDIHLMNGPGLSGSNA